MKFENIEAFHALRDYVYFCAASYEERSLVAAQNVWRLHAPEKTYIFHAVDCCELVDRAVLKLSAVFPSSKLVETHLDNPLLTARNIIAAVLEVASLGKKDVLIDITTFTHEQLLIMLRTLLMNSAGLGNICCVYAHSGEYSYGEAGTQKWLSKGCKGIRTVIGYPGLMIPGRSTTLVILSGFEYERAATVISEMEPDRLVIGTGLSEDGEGCAHQRSMREFQRLIREFCAMRSNVEEFEFSSQDVICAEKAYRHALSKCTDSNVVVIPMNTKLSTLALARLALKNEAIQVCYAQPTSYNVAAYSTPGDKLTFLKMFPCVK